MILSVRTSHLPEIATCRIVLVLGILLIAPADEVLAINLCILHLDVIFPRLLSCHLLGKLISNELILLNRLGSLLLLVPLIDPGVALLASNIWYISIFLRSDLLQTALQLYLVLDVICHMLRLVGSLVIFSFDPAVKISVNFALLLSDSLLINYFTFHRLDKPFQSVKLCLSLHFTKFAHRLMVFAIGEGAVHGAFDVLLD